jgi:DNA polymerase III sliding clamp (beta) subunit (PCNA family)
MIKEHERVVLKSPISGAGLEAGDVATVVHVYGDGKAYEVEFVALDGHTAAVVTVEASQVRPVAPSEIPHARELVAA